MWPQLIESFSQDVKISGVFFQIATQSFHCFPFINSNEQTYYIYSLVFCLAGNFYFVQWADLPSFILFILSFFRTVLPDGICINYIIMMMMAAEATVL